MSVKAQRKVASSGHTGPGSEWGTLRSRDVQILQAQALVRWPWVVHGFSTRLAGTSRLRSRHNPSRVLNLGFTPWDSRKNVLTNRGRFLAALGAPEMKLTTLRQFHSDLIHVFDTPPERSPRGDAAITRAPGLLLAVQTADCVPILLVDLKRRVVAAVHAGWRGTLRRIAQKTVGRMRMAFRARPQDVIAVLGPGIGRCCYQVGPEVAQAYASQFAAARDWFDGPFEHLAGAEEPMPLKWLSMAPPGHDSPPPRLRLDLAAANRWQLLEAGLKPSNIITGELCTACRTDLLFSSRKEKEHTGRLLGVIGIRPGSTEM